MDNPCEKGVYRCGGRSETSFQVSSDETGGVNLNV